MDIITSPQRLSELKNKLGINSNDQKNELTEEQIASLKFEEMLSLFEFARLLDAERGIKNNRKPMFYGSNDFEEVSAEKVKELLARIS